LTWEKSNPLGLGPFEEDAATLRKRIMFAYEQCLLCLSHHADIWIDGAMYLEETAKKSQDELNPLASIFQDDVVQFYDRGVKGTFYSRVSNSLIFKRITIAAILISLSTFIDYIFMQFSENVVKNAKIPAFGGHFPIFWNFSIFLPILEVLHGICKHLIMVDFSSSFLVGPRFVGN
jgi:hypothetical protein